MTYKEAKQELYKRPWKAVTCSQGDPVGVELLK